MPEFSVILAGLADAFTLVNLAFVLIGLGLLARERAHRLFGLLVLSASIINLTLRPGANSMAAAAFSPSWAWG